MKNETGLKSSSNGQIIGGSLISYATVGMNILLGLVYTPWILHQLGSSMYGLYTLSTSLIAIFLLDFGLSAAVTRFIATYRAENDYGGINQVFTLVIKFYIGIMVLMAVIFFLIFLNLDTIYANLETIESSYFKIIFIITSVCVVISFPVNVFNGVLNAFENYIELKLAELFNKIGTVLVTIIALALHGGIIALVVVNGGFNILTMTIKLFLVKKRTSVKFIQAHHEKKQIRDIASFSAWTTVTTVSQQMIFNIMPTILAMTLNTIAITMYGFANVIEGYVYTITSAINGLFLPKISRTISNQKDAASVLPLMIKVGRINQSIIGLLFGGIVITGKTFISLWIGEQYISVYYCMILLTAPYCISSSFQIANSSIIAMNKVRYSALTSLCTGIANLIIAFFVAPYYGVVGVCACICLTFFVQCVIMQIVYVKVLKINLKCFYIECHLKLLPGLLLSFGTAYVLIGCITKNGLLINGWLGFIFEVMIVTLIYGVVMWTIGWNRSEKELLCSIVKRRKVS